MKGSTGDATGHMPGKAGRLTLFLLPFLPAVGKYTPSREVSGSQSRFIMSFVNEGSERSILRRREASNLSSLPSHLS